jgi:hypothetical protein
VRDSHLTKTSENEGGLNQGDNGTKVTTEIENEPINSTAATDKPAHLDSENEESDSEIDERPQSSDVIGSGIRQRSNFGFALKRGNFNLRYIPGIRFTQFQVTIT